MDFRPVHAINVNGPVAPTDLSDRAKIESVNGALDVQFARGPSEECTIATINGGLPTGTGLDANTEHNDGDIESDFDVEPMMLPAKIEREERAMIDMVIASYSRPVCAWAQAVRHSPSARSMAISEFVITSEREHQENVCVCRAAQLVCWGGAGLEFWGVRTREAIVRRTTHKPTGRRCSLLAGVVPDLSSGACAHVKRSYGAQPTNLRAGAVRSCESRSNYSLARSRVELIPVIFWM